MGEKTEKATPKKLKDARKKGQVAKSKDFPSAFTFIVSISGVLASSNYLFQKLAGFMISMFGSIEEAARNPGIITAMANEAIQTIYSTSIPIMALVSAIGVVVNFLIVGPLFSMESMKPDIKKLNPVTNLKNMFKVKTFIELLKSILKITGAVILIYTVVHGSLSEIISTAALPVYGSALFLMSFWVKLSCALGSFSLQLEFSTSFSKRRISLKK